jgi:PAS domain S-box
MLLAAARVILFPACLVHTDMSKTVNPIRVLHVDDEPDLSDMVATFLEREDDRLTVCTATSANEGLETIDEADVDCIVSDYDMPSTNGIEFLEAVRESHPELPFILYTGKGSEEVAADAISAGVTDYLQKDRGTEQYAILANRIRNAVSAQWSAIESEQNRYRLERILKTIPSCVVQLDYEGRFIFANDRAVEVLGLEESELTDWAYNDPEWEIMDLNGNPISDEKLPFRQVRDSGEPLYGFRHTIKWSDGTQKNLLVNGTPLLDSNGETDSVIFSLTDITDQIEYQHQLTQATARLEALFENSPDMINIHDMEGNITDPNPLLCEEMGYDEDELTDMKVWELDQEMNPHKAHTLWEGMNQGDRKRIEGVYQRRDGSELPVEVHIRYLYVDGEDRFMVISRDITET